MKKYAFAVLVALIAVSGFAQGQGHGGPPPAGMQPGMDGHGGGGHDGGPHGPGLIVGSDGTVYVVSHTPGATPGTGTTKLTAIRSTGATAWTITLANPESRLSLSGSNLLSVSTAKNADGTFTSTVTALSTTTGVSAWSLTIPGLVGELTPFSGGTYAVVVVPGATSGAAATRSLVAISSSGSILWTVALP